VTAYTALTGSPRGIRAGSIVLVQGTGGVSILAAQIAAASGCRVIATSSSDAKLQRLQQMGLVRAEDCVNYKKDPDWGRTVRALTPDSRGVDLVVEVGGPGTVAQSLCAVRRGGELALVGLLADGVGGTGGPDYATVLMNLISVRGVLVGPRADFRALMECLAANRVRPVVDRAFPFAQAVDAYRYVQSGSHFGKVVVTIE
jgi:NADPH:quinone reductase-like Zn-dependent oxidoreductase